MAAMVFIFGLLAFIFLTIVTQIGGVALLLGWLLVRIFARPGTGRWLLRAEVAALSTAIYAILTFGIVPPLASLSGRVPLACGTGPDRPYASASWIYCAFNRNYVTPRARDLLDGLARHMNTAYPGTETLYLDGNFPFFDGFPLIPHLSHDDGRKLDLAFYYTNASGKYLPGAARSPIGYFAFEQPRGGGGACGPGSAFSLRWDMDWLQPLLPDMPLDEERTRAALDWLTSSGGQFGVEKIFLEPHLVQRLGVGSPLIRFQGCRAARHDDHIHVQVRP